MDGRFALPRHRRPGWRLVFIGCTLPFNRFRDAGIKKLPPHNPRRVLCKDRTNQNDLATCGATLLAALYGAAPLRRTIIPLPCNGGFRHRILSPAAFPRALCEPFVCPASGPTPSNGGSLCVRLQFYFRFIGLKLFNHIHFDLSTLFVQLFVSAGEVFAARSISINSALRSFRLIHSRQKARIPSRR